MLSDDIARLIDLINQVIVSPGGRSRYMQDILAALRGPDNVKNRALKMYTTARIRAIVTPTYHGDVRFIPLNRKEMLERDLLLTNCNIHFGRHYKLACNTIRTIYKYDLVTEQGVKAGGLLSK